MQHAHAIGGDQPTLATRIGADTGAAQMRPDGSGADLADLVVIDGPTPVEAFDYRWPVNTEHFDSGWQVVVATGGRERRARIGLGWRESYGALRRRLVVWIDGQPVAEGAGTDDYESTLSLVCALKHADQRLVRPGDEVPVAYARFPLVNQAQEIDGPYNRRALAVKFRETDLISWIGFALARLAARAETPSATTPHRNRSASALPADVSQSMTVQDLGRTSAPSDQGAIVRALLEFGARHAPDEVGAATFTPHPEANALIINNPFAFLLAVIFDQGIPAERAWRAPYDLMQRLGHLDPQRMIDQPDSVRSAVAQPPVLHRYRERMPEWLVSAARIVASDYHGDASRLWTDHPTAAELQRRFDRFPGIGQKKAAMAVEILERDLGIPVRNMRGSDVAYDVHLRRVVLRTQLAMYDDLDHILSVTRRLHPERPGALDFPAWLIGRQWCHAGTPDCPDCPLASVCPKDIDRANNVRGA